MDPVRWHSHPRLRRPMMVVAFEGWNDAADAASTAIDHLARTCQAEAFASIDPEEFFDFTATRPRARIDADLNRSIEWPGNELLAAHRPDGPHDLVLLSGTEPNLRWRTFAEAIVGIAVELGVQMTVSLGALLADVAHTRPVRVTGTAADGELAERLHLRRSRYEGPTGILGILSDSLGRAGIPTASLWAAVPHYVSQTPSPKAALALLERASSIIGVPPDALDLQIASSSYERQVTDLVQADPDVAEYVAQLERDEPEADGITMTAGESLAEEVERFLREHGK
ncbi:MAG TPA: PAC2 family protein [Acidimicrobiales bacterium]|nr:PAC2 family protein [Acidimicrobiales bacterium]